MPPAVRSLYLVMLVEIYSDVVCPWCYIGKRRFEDALARFDGRDDVTVVYRPFQLDPRAPTEPTPVVDAYARKFGGPEEAARIIERVTDDRGAREGSTSTWRSPQRANTFDAHRLIGLRPASGASRRAMKERLLRAYFIEGQRRRRPRASSADLAADVGLDADEVAGVPGLRRRRGRAARRAARQPWSAASPPCRRSCSKAAGPCPARRTPTRCCGSSRSSPRSWRPEPAAARRVRRRRLHR